ncbi:MAG: hypothetical protein ABFE01_12170 [Phycisphaerales bacterium]
MTRTLLTSLCVAASLVSLACRSKPQAAVTPEEPTAVTTGDTPSPDPNSVLFGDEDKIADRRTVESKYETLDGKRILWVKMDLVKVSVNVQDVIEHFDRRFVELPHLTDEKALADKFRAEPDVREYRYDDFGPNEKDRLFFCVTALLENGSFLMTFNDTGARVPRIVACKYSQIHSPMDGYAGRMFLLEDERVLLRTMDRIY